MNRITNVSIDLTEQGHFEVSVTKEFPGGTQVFKEFGGHQLHRALDVARGMATLSPRRRHAELDLDSETKGWRAA